MGGGDRMTDEQINGAFQELLQAHNCLVDGLNESRAALNELRLRVEALEKMVRVPAWER